MHQTCTAPTTKSHDYDPANENDRAELRQQLLATGSVLASVGHCGDDNLPCGVCEECVTQGQDCDDLRGGRPEPELADGGRLGILLRLQGLHGPRQPGRPAYNTDLRSHGMRNCHDLPAPD